MSQELVQGWEVYGPPKLTDLLNPHAEWSAELRQYASEKVFAHNAALLGVTVKELQNAFKHNQKKWFADRIYGLRQYEPIQRKKTEKSPALGRVEIIVSPDHPLDVLLTRHPGGRICLTADVEEGYAFESLKYSPTPTGIHILNLPIDLHPTALYFDLDGTLRPSSEQFNPDNMYLPVDPKVQDLLDLVAEAQYDMRGWTYGSARALRNWKDSDIAPFNEIIGDGQYFSRISGYSKSHFDDSLNLLRRSIDEFDDDIKDQILNYLLSLVGPQKATDSVYAQIAQRLSAINMNLMFCRVPEMRAAITRGMILPEYIDEQRALRDPFRQNSLTVIDDPYFPGTIALGGNTVHAPFRSIERLPELLLQLKAGQQIGRMRAE